VLRYEIDWVALERSLAQPSTRLFLFCNPHNPTGRCWTRDDVRRVASLCTAHNVLLCSDEVWGEMPLEPSATPFTSVLAMLPEVEGLRERLIVLTSPSKCFNVATLNIALAVVPDPALQSMFLAAGRDQAEVTPFGFFAAEAAFGPAESEAWRQRLIDYVRANRDYAIARLGAVPGMLTTRPESSYLLWVDASAALPAGAKSAADHLLSHGVGVSEGVDFGGAPGCFRINLACLRTTLERGLGRVVDAFTKPGGA